MDAWPILKDDTRPSYGIYMVGSNVMTCKVCGSHYMGHKESHACADCSYGFREGRWLARASRRRNQW